MVYAGLQLILFVGKHILDNLQLYEISQLKRFAIAKMTSTVSHYSQYHLVIDRSHMTILNL